MFHSWPTSLFDKQLTMFCQMWVDRNILGLLKPFAKNIKFLAISIASENILRALLAYLLSFQIDGPFMRVLTCLQSVPSIRLSSSCFFRNWVLRLISHLRGNSENTPKWSHEGTRDFRRSYRVVVTWCHNKTYLSVFTNSVRVWLYRQK